MPLLSRLLQCLVSLYGTFLTCSSHRELHGHNRQTKEHQEDQIKQYKCATAALAGHVRELPYIPDANGTAGRQQYKA